MSPARLLWLAVCAMACSAPTVREAPFTPVVGVTELGVVSHGTPLEAEQTVALHMHDVRVTYDPALRSVDYDATFAARLLHFRDQGVTPLVVVHHFTAGTDIASTVADLTHRFPGTVWQVGNEGDAEVNGGMTGTQYAALMRSVVALAPEARFVGMGLSCTDNTPWSRTPDVVRQPAFLRAYLAAGGPMLDAWAIHTYGADLAHAVTVRVQATNAVLRGRMPLYLTEIGYDTIDDATQSAQLVAGLNAAHQNGVTRAYLYDLWDGPGNFGLYQSDRITARAVVAALTDR